MTDQMDARVFLLLMAARLVGDYVYAWGGEDPDEGGFDCSGFVCTALTQAARAWPNLYDGDRRTAAGLHAYYDDRGCPDIKSVEQLTPGCLVFYWVPGSTIHHIAVHATTVPPLNGDLDVGPVGFESGGGGGSTLTPRAALLKSAGIRLTATDHHGEGVLWVAKDPFMAVT